MNITIAVIPVRGRAPLIEKTIYRLLYKNNVDAVVCVGDSENDRLVCGMSGAHWVYHDNYPLGAKWNAGFKEAARLGADNFLFVGSGDWLSDNWLQVILPLMDEYDMVGKPDFYLLDIAPPNFRMCHWAGYTDERRKGEPIGIGRVLSRRILEKLNFEPFDPHLDSSMDWSMYNHVMQVGGKIKLIEGDEIKSLSISTDRWGNKHNFENHYNGRIPSERVQLVGLFLDEHFPEAYKIFEHERMQKMSL